MHVYFRLGNDWIPVWIQAWFMCWTPGIIRCGSSGVLHNGTKWWVSLMKYSKSMISLGASRTLIWNGPPRRTFSLLGWDNFGNLIWRIKMHSRATCLCEGWLHWFRLKGNLVRQPVTNFTPRRGFMRYTAALLVLHSTQRADFVFVYPWVNVNALVRIFKILL